MRLTWRGRTAYDLLEIAPDASDDEVKAAYKFHAKAWHPDGFYYFVDIRAHRLHRIAPGGAAEVVREQTGEGNGTTFDLEGRLLMCEGGWRETMVGTLGLYDAEGDRQHTIYLAATP